MRLLMWLIVLFAVFVLAGLIGRCDMRHAQPRSACRTSLLRRIDFDNVEPVQPMLSVASVCSRWPDAEACSAKEAAS